jgi:hypothetical protein
MKRTHLVPCVLAALSLLLWLGAPRLQAADTAFRYQGTLADAGQPAEGSFDLQFVLHASETGNDPLGQPFLALTTPVTNGLFTVDVDFGAGLFNGDTRWVEIAIRPADSPEGFVTLAPRQPLRATPYALYALEAASAASASVATETPWQGLTSVPEGFADGVDHDTLYSPGPGLDLIDGSFAVRFDGPGSAETVARSDHSHPPGDADTLDGRDSLDFAPIAHDHALAELSGPLADDQLSPNIPRLDAHQSFTGTNRFDGVVLLTNLANIVAGTFAGDGANLTNLQGSVLSPGSVPSEALADASVSNSKLAPGAVGSDALIDASVTTAKIAPGAVSTPQIAADAVDSGRIADATVLPADLDLSQFDAVLWKVTGNAGIAGFLGTTDHQPLELRVLGTRALRLEPNGTNSVNLLAGSVVNAIDPNVSGATIAGGGSAEYLGAPHANRVAGDFGTVGGGSRNVVEPTAQWSTIAGGLANAIRLNAQWSTIAGGNRNQIETDADGATIAGGRTNTVNPAAVGATIAGGAFNRILTNTAFAAIPGGLSNSVAGNFSFAAGLNAAALHPGAFVWADASGPPQPSSATNQFTVRAAGGTRIFSNASSTSGVRLAPGDGAWSNLSDRDSKTGFAPVDPLDVLERVAHLPIHTWRYHTQTPQTRHLGPTAQDFHAQFQLGGDDRHISTVDADGVALASIQGLNLKLETELRRKESELAELREQMTLLSARLDEIMALRATNP